jgi:hypothetical protein
LLIVKMKKIILLITLISTSILAGKAQSVMPVFDTISFNQNLAFANRLIEYEFYTQQAVDKFSKVEDVSAMEWFSFPVNKTWHTVGGEIADTKFKILHHVTFDSLNDITEYTGSSDTFKLNSCITALTQASVQFKPIHDSVSIYLSTFVLENADQSISVWILPALQPSGQAIYGCEWEYIYDKTGKQLIRKNSFTQALTGVWIGQPRELWLNYRSTGKPTVGSLFFTQSFRDYFTRIRVDTQMSTSTTAKDKNGNYTWTHKMK